MACSYENYESKEVPKTCEDDFNELQFELKQWKNATFIRILVNTAKDHDEDDVVKLWKNEHKKSQYRELFLLCDKGRTETLFGKTFAALVDARISVKELAEEEEKSQTPDKEKIDNKREEVEKKIHLAVETRAQKRQRLE